MTRVALCRPQLLGRVAASYTKRGRFSPSPPPGRCCLSPAAGERAGRPVLLGDAHARRGSPARRIRRPRHCRGSPRLRVPAAAGRAQVVPPLPPGAPAGRAMEPGAPPDLRDVEQKLGRKVPESLARPLRGEELPARPAAAAPGPRRRRAAALAHLETKLQLLRQEMVSSRAPAAALPHRSAAPATARDEDRAACALPAGPPRQGGAACPRSSSRRSSILRGAGRQRGLCCRLGEQEAARRCGVERGACRLFPSQRGSSSGTRSWLLFLSAR